MYKWIRFLGDKQRSIYLLFWDSQMKCSHIKHANTSIGYTSIGTWEHVNTYKYLYMILIIYIYILRDRDALRMIGGCRASSDNGGCFLPEDSRMSTGKERAKKRGSLKPTLHKYVQHAHLSLK